MSTYKLGYSEINEKRIYFTAVFIHSLSQNSSQIWNYPSIYLYYLSVFCKTEELWQLDSDERHGGER